jgi:hypothetical protein
MKKRLNQIFSFIALILGIYIVVISYIDINNPSGSFISLPALFVGFGFCYVGVRIFASTLKK